jgi:DNA-binding transcriptional ArsR family regulator
MAIRPIYRATKNRQATRKGRQQAASLLQEMLPHAQQAASLLRALANEQRLLILCNLSAGELSVGQLNERVPLNQSALSQHLAVLSKTGAVNTRRESQTVYYSLKPGPAADVIATLHGIYCQ